MIEQMQHTLHTDSLSIGSPPFDPRKTPILFSGLTMTREWILPRIISVLVPLLLLPLAGLLFHGKLQNLCKPISRRAVSLVAGVGRGGSLGGAVWIDAVLTFTLFPWPSSP